MEVREICLAHVKEISQLFNEIFSREPWNDEWSEEDLSIYMHDLVGNRLSLSIRYSSLVGTVNILSLTFEPV